MAREAPVLVSVDDVQWLDQASGEVIGFAARRVRREPIGFLVAQRIAEHDEDLPGPLRRAFGDDRLVRVTVGPLTLGALQHILRARIGTTLPRSVLPRIHEMSGGNPFFGLEIARALERRDEPLGPGDPLAVVAALASSSLIVLVAQPVQGGRVVAHVLDRFRHARPRWRKHPVAPTLEALLPVLPALRRQPEAVDQNDGRGGHAALLSGPDANGTQRTATRRSPARAG